MNLCHEWSKEEWHTHIGHETLGAHIRHWNCLHCEAVLSQGVEGGKFYIIPAEVSHYAKSCRLPQYHKCSSGWRGKVVYEAVI